MGRTLSMRRSLCAVVLAMAAGSVSTGFASGPNCGDLLGKMNLAIGNADADLAVRVANEAQTYCESPDAARARLAAGAVLMKRLLRPELLQAPEHHEKELLQVLKYGGFWQAERLLGDIAFRRRDYKVAADHYQRALDVATEVADGRPGLPAQRPPDEALLDRIARQAELSRLAAPDFVPLTRDRDGNLAGQAVLLRSATPKPFVQPVRFEYDDIRFTEIGRRYAEELRDVIQQQQRDRGIRSLTLVGHTDASGDAQYNLNLSRRRAEALATWLKEQGVSITIRSEGRGEAEPIDLGGNEMPREEFDQANRRVEVVFPSRQGGAVP